jgi:MFS family permease
MATETYKDIKHNLTVNLMDGAFFGFGIGFASFVTVIPLFVSTMTGSALLIGLIPAIHNTGWQLPQLFTANWVARQRRIKKMVLALTILERIPFLGLALVAGFYTSLGAPVALALTYLLLIFQGLGAGLTANPWTSMIGKIIPSDRRGTFFGAQAAAANLLASLSAFLAGVALQKLPSPLDFVLCFVLCGVAMGISWWFLSLTREPEGQPVVEAVSPMSRRFWGQMGGILVQDHNFRWFLIARTFSMLAVMGFAFYAVYAVNEHGASEIGVGAMTTIYLVVQILANILMGWIGDRWSRKRIMEIGIGAGILSALCAWWAPSAGWFYLVYALAAVANVAIWTIGIAMNLEFGTESDRPAYIGMANTLLAPANILAPFLAGWLAEIAGYPAAFLASAAGGLVSLLIFILFVNDPRSIDKAARKIEPSESFTP